jgi:alkanesulfonate monooxygenase SsuD/methylene tetrahydromethanopterin reductase-like flavin-dependent oxidoreductase (luciferase family)
MDYDIFFSISQTPVDGRTPSEREMFANFFEQVVAADELGYGTAWIAESHLSSEVQKRNKSPVIPHWQGEVGLNCDFLQLSHQVFKRTRRIETGSAVMNILCSGGPIAHAERVAAFCALHGVDPAERRRINVGFAQGRFDFMNRAMGIVPRDALEEAAWPALKGKVFEEAAHVFCRLLRGDVLSSDEVPRPTLSRADFKTEAEWAKVCTVAGGHDPATPLELRRRWEFEALKVVPQEWRRELLQLVIGSHHAPLQEAVNAIQPVQVFNLSITQPAVIEDTHRRLTKAYHPSGGPWKRAYMPRTVFVFVNEEPGLSPVERRARAKEESRKALNAYWTALEGTLDPKKVENAADNALVGNADDIAEQMVARFHPDDRLMLWFDFFNHDSARVVSNMRAFMREVAPRVTEKLAAKAATA